jgi:acyl carrier protein
VPVETPSADALLVEIREQLSALLETPLTPDDDELALAELVPERYDSLGVLECVGMVEQRFDVVVDLLADDLRTTFRSIASIAALVERKRADAAVLGLAP